MSEWQNKLPLSKLQVNVNFSGKLTFRNGINALARKIKSIDWQRLQIVKELLPYASILLGGGWGHTAGYGSR